jgi:hypothetical protein
MDEQITNDCRLRDFPVRRGRREGVIQEVWQLDGNRFHLGKVIPMG